MANNNSSNNNNMNSHHAYLDMYPFNLHMKCSPVANISEYYTVSLCSMKA